MRGFIITSIIFSFILIVIIFNAFYMKSLVEDMKTTVESLNHIPCEENSIIIDRLCEHWEKAMPWLSLSVSYEDIEGLTDLLDSLKATNSTENLEQFRIHIELLLNALDEIGRLEKISIKNIL